MSRNFFEGPRAVKGSGAFSFYAERKEGKDYEVRGKSEDGLLPYAIVGC